MPFNRPRFAVRSSRPGLRTTALAALAAAVLAPMGSAWAQTPAPGGSPLVPVSGSYLGIYAAAEGSLSSAATTRQLESQIGHQFAIKQVFVPRGKSLGPVVAADAAEGSIPLITFGSGYPSADVAAGRYDAYFTALARQIAALGGPVYLRYAHEMDGRANASWVQSPAAFVAGWRHVHDLFARAGVTNSAWVWEPNAFAFTGTYGSTKADAYYPGDAYVDWVGADGYNWGACRGKLQWKSFAGIFQAFYAWGGRKGRPMIITEFGTVEHPTIPTAKADWYRQAAQTLAATMPQIRAAVYFSSSHATKGCDWRPNTSATSLAGFVSMARTPLLATAP